MNEIQDPNELIKQANQCSSRGQYEEAIALYRQAIGLAPDSPIYAAYKFVIGEMLMNLGRHQEAVQVFGEVIAKTPEHDQAWCDLGQCLMVTGEYHRAAHAFERCLEIAPDTAEAWYYGAMVHAQLGQDEQAREYLRKALSLKPAWKKQAQSDPLLKAYLPQRKAWWKFIGL
ncbi:MAG: tetratricopeptide repeat protein [Thermoflexales bacterium]|nr:tetratricopeptide repeat protein [Thermoflexales bacterium]